MNETAGEPRLILLADPDRQSAEALQKALSEKGYSIIVARDGSKALEMSILNLPDLVLFDQRCPLIGPQKFDQIIRNNPRTENIPVIIIGRPEMEFEFRKTFREGFIARPFSLPQFLEQVDAFFRRMDAATALKVGNRLFEGDLAQMGIPDLVQVFALNRRTGILSVTGQGIEGRIHLSNGDVVHAETHGASGEKAFFRLLAATRGRFSFDPGAEGVKHTMSVGTDNLLMEGARQLDEYRRVLEEIPREHGRFHVSTRIESSYRLEGLHPVTEEVLSIVELNPTLQELLNSTSATDFETLRALKALLDRDIVEFKPAVMSSEVRAAAGAPEYEPLLRRAEVERFKAFIRQRYFNRFRTARPKVLVLSPRGNLLKSFVRRLKLVEEFSLLERPAALRLGFGTIGKLALDHEFALSVLLIPSERQNRPILNSMSAGAVCAIFLSTGAAVEIADTMSLSTAAGSPLVRLVPVLHVVAPGSDLDSRGSQEVSAFIETGEMRGTPAKFDLGKAGEVRALLQRLLLACGGQRADA
jgi:CheY-like chemotaxis protein